MEEISFVLTNNQVISIIQRFRNKFHYRLNPYKNIIIENNIIENNIIENNILCLKTYIRPCKYAKEIGKLDNKNHLVIKYKDNQQSQEISLSVFIDDYKDLI